MTKTFFRHYRCVLGLLVRMVEPLGGLERRKEEKEVLAEVVVVAVVVI